MATPENRPHILERVVKEGIRCPNCACGYCPVERQEVRKIHFQGNERVIVRRRRICQHCQLPFSTVETSESEDILGLPDLIASVPSFAEQLEQLKTESGRSGVLLPKEKQPPDSKKSKNPYLEE